MELDRLRLTPQEFMALPEYSATFPTGTTIGKRWRRLDGAHDYSAKARGHKPVWLIGEFIENDDPKLVGIKWWKPIIVVPPVVGPSIPYEHVDMLHKIAARAS